MTNDERVNKLRPDALGTTPPENMLGSKKLTQNKPQLSRQSRKILTNWLLAIYSSLKNGKNP